MQRNVDLRCTGCHRGVENVMLEENATVSCIECGSLMEQVWWKRPRGPAQWDDNTAVVVHIDPKTGDVRYPGRNDAIPRAGYERKYLRSLHEVEKFEQANNVRSEMAWYDQGSLRGFDDYQNGQKITH